MYLDVLFFFQFGKIKYYKLYYFDYKNEVFMLVGNDKLGIGGELFRGQKVRL